MGASITVPSTANTDVIPASLLTTLGDLAVRGSSAVIRKPAGANGTALIARSGSPGGLNWESVSGSGALPSINDLSSYASANSGLDERTHLQNAINACAPGDKLWVPSGEYIIGSPGVTSNIDGFTVEGPTFNMGVSGGVVFHGSGTAAYTIWTHTGSGQNGATFANLHFEDPNEQKRNLTSDTNSPKGGVYSSGTGEITFNTTTSHPYNVGDKVWTRNAWPKGFNGRWIVKAVPSSTSFTVDSPWNPGTFSFASIYNPGDPYQGGFAAREPKINGLRLSSGVRWKVARCAFSQLRQGLNIHTQGSNSDDSSWGHSEDNVFTWCDVGLLYDGPGNFSTWVTGGNTKLGDDQVAYWFVTGSHQKILGMKIDTSMPNGQGKSVVGDRTIGILFENNDGFEMAFVNYELESDSYAVVGGTGTYTPAWAANLGSNSWNRTSGSSNGSGDPSTGGVINALTGSTSDWYGSISNCGFQHNDSNDGKAIVLRGAGHVTVNAPTFQGSGFRTCIEVGGSTEGCSVIGGADQIGNGSHVGVDILGTAKGTVVNAFHRTNDTTSANHIHDAGTNTKLTNVIKAPGSAPVTT